MLKRTIAIILTITALLALSACGLFSPAQTEEVMTFDVSEFTEIESEVDTTTETTEEEFEHTSSSEDYEYDEVDVPAPISAVWGNKKVTLECDIVTDIRWPSDMGVIYYKNDYAVFCNYGKYSEPIDYETLGFNVLDKNGNIVLAENLQNLSHFDSNGIAKVHYENKLDKFYYINLKGERIDKEAYDGYNVTGPEQADCEALGIRHEGVGRYYIGETEVNHIGNNYNGLIPFLVGLPDSANSLLGLMDTDLNIVIPATMEVYLPYHLGFYISEDRLVVNLDGRIAILKLTVEETLETEEGTLEDQALSLTTHIVRYAMTSDWLEGKLEFTDERMTQFVYALATLDEDDADHPYSDLSATLVENGHSYGLLEKEKAERALLEVFGEDVTFPLDKDNSMIVDGYIRVPHEVGFSTTMYHPKDMTARVDGDLVRVTCSLEYEDRADFEVDDIGDYELVYKLIRDGEREYLRLDSINRINNPEKLEFSGVYNGSTITMTLKLTEYNFSTCQFVPAGFVNGYITLCYHGKSGEENVCQARALFDKNGKMVLEPIYDSIGAVSPEGKVVAYLADNEEDRGKLTGNTKPYLIDLKNNTMTLITEEESKAHRLALENKTSKTINPEYSIKETKKDWYYDYTVFDKDGNECYTFEDALSAYFVSDETIWCLYDDICALYDVYGNRISPETQVIGNFEDGLAAFVADGKLGIISEKGEVIISTQIEVKDRFSFFQPHLWLNEGLMRVDVDGILGIVEISRSNEIDVEGFFELDWKSEENGAKVYVTKDEIIDFDKSATFVGGNHSFAVTGNTQGGFNIISENRSLWGHGGCLVKYYGNLKEDSENIVPEDNAMYGTVYEYTGDGSDVMFSRMINVYVPNVTYNDYVDIWQKVLEYQYGDKAAEYSQSYPIPYEIVEAKDAYGEDTVLKDIQNHGDIGRISLTLTTGDDMQDSEYIGRLPQPLENRLKICFK